MNAAWRTALWLLPLPLCAWIHWLGFRTWFHLDDFAWLGISRDLEQWSELPALLFAPQAQGTIRPWSERLFFLAGFPLFGLNYIPYKLAVAGVFSLNLVLLQAIARRVTGSRLAGVLAPVLWLFSVGVAVPLGWLSCFNQVLCAAFLLLAFWFLLRWLETGRRCDLAGQWAAFLLGFGALETMVVYPLLAAVYVWLRHRERIRTVLWLCVPSLAYTALHFAVAPSPEAGPYHPQYGFGMIASALDYWVWGVTGKAVGWHGIGALPVWFSPAAAAWVSLPLAAWLLWSVRRKRFDRLFPVAWFFILLAPYLPLVEHRMDYYLLLPAAGLALALAWGAAEAVTLPLGARAAAALALAVYGIAGWNAVREASGYWYRNALAVRGLILGVQELHARHPQKMILLAGVSNELFWTGMIDKPFRLFGAREVYFLPGEEERVAKHPELGDPAIYAVAPERARRALAEGRAIVITPDGERVRNVTSRYTAASGRIVPLPPRRIFFGDGPDGFFIGPGFYGPVRDARWMSRVGEFEIAGPVRRGQTLLVRALFPMDGPTRPAIQVRASADGVELGRLRVERGAEPFEWKLALPDALLYKLSIRVRLEADHVFIPPRDGNELSILLYEAAVR